MDKEVLLTKEELIAIKPGEAIAIGTVMAILVTALITVIVYRFFVSKEGSATIPGGFKFSWDS